MGALNACPLCDVVDSQDFVLENRSAVVIPDAFPLSPGHHLILPRRHEPDFFSLDPNELLSIVQLLELARRLIHTKWRPDGFNVGVNVGSAAGQTISHVHMHVIPRYQGDSHDPRGGIRLILPDRARYWELDSADPDSSH